MPKIGLALGGGGARGWAHLGVIRAFQDAGIKIGCVAGTSMGALVGAAFAGGHLDALEASAHQVNWKDVLYYFFEVGLPRSGLIDGRKVVAFLQRHIPTTRIEQLPMPFAAVATDLETGQEVILWRGNVLEAVRASISIPGVFTPTCWDGRSLVDGGLVNPVPVSAARALGAEWVVAVDVRPTRLVRARRSRVRGEYRAARQWEKMPLPPAIKPLLRRIALLNAKMSTQIHRWRADRGDLTIFDVLGNSIAIMQAQITDIRLRLDRPDMVIHPETDFGLMDFQRAAEAIEIGYRAAARAIREHRLSASD